MTKHEITIYADLSQTDAYTLEELISASKVPSEFVEELIAFEIILPQKEANQTLRFTVQHINRTQTAYRLHKDLEVNIAGVAVVLDLLDEVETLRSALALLEKHYLP